VVGCVASVWPTTPVTCVLRRWPSPEPDIQATEQSRISRCGELASRLKIKSERHGSPRRPRRSNLTILSESFGQIKFGATCSEAGTAEADKARRATAGMGTAAAAVAAAAVDRAEPAAADLDMADLAAVVDIASGIQPAAALVSQADMSTLP
jgi:hypothetical protein